MLSGYRLGKEEGGLRLVTCSANADDGAPCSRCVSLARSVVGVVGDITATTGVGKKYEIQVSTGHTIGFCIGKLFPGSLMYLVRHVGPTRA